MTDERRDDEIIGRALSRAIETIDVNQTPFERSRIAMEPSRRGFFGVWQIASAAAAIVLALAIGSWLTRPAEDRGPVAASPTAASASSSPASTTPPPASATPAQDRIWVYFARDGLPPTGAFVTGSFLPGSPESRIASRITALGTAQASNQVPAGTISALTLKASGGISVRVQGDLATVEFDTPTWDVRGSAQSQALLQQLVYTITEEPGIRRALITEKGKPNAVIDQLVIDGPLTREDVFGYSSTGKLGASGAIADGGNTAASYQVGITTSVDTLASGLARVVLTFKSPQGADVSELPEFSASLDHSDSAASPNNAKYLLGVQLRAAQITFTTADLVVDRAPLRFVRGSGTTVGIGLDDARPWRLFTLTNPARIVVDIGGPTQSVSDRVAVYQPRPGATVTRDLQLTGAARTFEANVNWRLLDSAGREAAKGTFTGGSGGAVWGTFDTRIAIPASVSGSVTLEVYEASARDGSPQGVVQIPLTVR
jgi:hypothetical protein